MLDPGKWLKRGDPSKSSPREIKARLRKLLLADRTHDRDGAAHECEGTLDQAEITQQFTDRLIDLVGKAAKPGMVIATYQPMSSEPDVTGFTDYLLAKGVVVVIPDLSVPPAGERVPFRLIKGEMLPEGLTLEQFLENHEIYAIIVPSLALDQDGVRLGRGAGWYDRVLRRFTTGDSGYSRQPTLIGVAFEDEFSAGDSLPMEEHDQQMDYVVTEDRTLAVPH